MTGYKYSEIPADGDKITVDGRELVVPENPIIPFIEGDGIGPDIWSATQSVIDAAVHKVYEGERRIAWMEVYAGDKAHKQTGNFIPDETFDVIQEFKVGIKGPLTTPVGLSLIHI